MLGGQFLILLLGPIQEEGTILEEKPPGFSLSISETASFAWLSPLFSLPN